MYLVDEEVSQRAIAITARTGKLTARELAYILRGIGRKIGRAHRQHKLAPKGRQSVKRLMLQSASTNSIEITGAPKEFDRVARRWKVDYAFYKTGPDKYLLFFKSGQADAIIACFSEYSRRVLAKGKSSRTPILEQLKDAREQVTQRKPREKERTKEAVREDR